MPVHPPTLITVISLVTGCVTNDAPAPVATPAAGPPIVLTLPDLVEQQRVNFVVTGLNPNDNVTIAASARGIGTGPCPPFLGGACFGVRGPAMAIGTERAGPDGIAYVRVLLPPTLAPGTPLAFQAVVPQGRAIQAILSLPKAGRILSDWDGDGYSADNGADCDDFDPGVHPGQFESPDGVDENCNGWVDEVYIDGSSSLPGDLWAIQGPTPYLTAVVFAPGTWVTGGIRFEADVAVIGEPGAEIDLASGVLELTSAAVVDISGLTIRGGAGGGGRGGCIYNDGGHLSLTDATVEMCAGGYGGGLHQRGAVASSVIYGSTFRGNTAVNGGGGIYIGGGHLELHRSIIAENSAGTSGGGVYIDFGNTSLMSNVVVSENQSGWDGGGLQVEGPLTATSMTFAGNVAGGVGAGVRVWGVSATAAIDSSIFWENVAGSGGGSIDWTTAYTVTLSHTTTGASSPNDLYGGSWNDAGGNLFNEPTLPFLAWTRDGVYDDDLRLRSTSSTVDSGNPAIGFDPDGSAPDRGAWGGPASL